MMFQSPVLFCWVANKSVLYPMRVAGGDTPPFCLSQKQTLESYGQRPIATTWVPSNAPVPVNEAIFVQLFPPSVECQAVGVVCSIQRISRLFRVAIFIHIFPPVVPAGDTVVVESEKLLAFAEYRQPVVVLPKRVTTF